IGRGRATGRQGEGTAAADANRTTGVVGPARVGGAADAFEYEAAAVLGLDGAVVGPVGAEHGDRPLVVEGIFEVDLASSAGDRQVGPQCQDRASREQFVVERVAEQNGARV